MVTRRTSFVGGGVLQEGKKEAEGREGEIDW
jgi:hypothetical protein